LRTWEQEDNEAKKDAMSTVAKEESMTAFTA